MSFFNGLIVAREQALGAQLGSHLTVTPAVTPVIGEYPRKKRAKLRRQTVSPNVLTALKKYLEWKLG